MMELAFLHQPLLLINRLQLLSSQTQLFLRHLQPLGA
jgi:hypothetical protein